MQALGTRAVGEGAARASGACGLNKLVPIKRRFAHLSPAARCLLIDLTPPYLYTAVTLTPPLGNLQPLVTRVLLQGVPSC